MPRRGENIYRRRDGRWEGRYIADRDSGGKAIYRSVYGASYNAVRQKLVDCRESTRKQQFRNCTMTVASLLDSWQAENQQIKPTSRERYRLLICQHIRPELGHYRVCDLTEDILNAFAVKKLKSGRLDGKGGLSQKTVNDMCIVVKSALKLARRKFQYTGAAEFEIPSIKRKSVEVLCEWESRRISSTVLREPTSHNVPYLLCLETGIRLGEACALRWSDIDFAGGLLHIRRTAYRINYGGRTELVIQSPKTTTPCGQFR